MFYTCLSRDRWISNLRCIALVLLFSNTLIVSMSVSALETESAVSAPVTVDERTDEPEVATATADKVRNQTRVAEMPQGVLQLDQTVISGNQELPKVLYILPWREPQGLPEIEVEAETVSQEVFRRLYPPAYRREMSYFETLNGIRDDQDNQEK